MDSALMVFVVINILVNIVLLVFILHPPSNSNTRMNKTNALAQKAIKECVQKVLDETGEQRAELTKILVQVTDLLRDSAKAGQADDADNEFEWRLKGETGW